MDQENSTRTLTADEAKWVDTLPKQTPPSPEMVKKMDAEKKLLNALFPLQ